MTKRTRSEYEGDGLPLVTEGIEVAATSKVEIPATTELSEESQNTVGIPESQVPARVVITNVEVGERSGNKMAHANKAVVGGLDTCPFWALLIRAGYELW